MYTYTIYSHYTIIFFSQQTRAGFFFRDNFLLIKHVLSVLLSQYISLLLRVPFYLPKPEMTYLNKTAPHRGNKKILIPTYY
jgi:hypothetical protein